MNKTITMIPVAELYPHPNNPRKNLGDLTELADSIAAKGVLQNLTVVPGHDGRMDGYTVIIGHRRLAAAKKAGLDALPCSIADLTEQEQIETMLLENMQRSDLTVYEQAQGFQMMLDFGQSMEEVAKKTGFSRNTIKHRLEIMKLDQKVLSKVSARQVSLTDFMKLEKLEDLEYRNKVLASIGTKNFENELKTALDDEKKDRNIHLALELLDGFAEDGSEMKEFFRLESELSLNMRADSCIDAIKELVEKGPGSYKHFYKLEVQSSTWLYIRRFDPDKKQQEDAEKERREAYEKDVEAILGELSEAGKRHYQLRCEFVKGLLKTGVLKAVPDSENKVGSMFFTVLTYKETTGGYGTDWAVIQAVLGRKFKKASDYRWETRPDANDVLEFIGAMPTLNKMLLYWYGMFEGGANAYAVRSWAEKCASIRKADINRLQRLYGYLSDLGYQVSDEEASMMDGTHELFAKADQLRDEYLKELEAAGDEE